MLAAEYPIRVICDVVECARTWDFLDPSERQYRPIPLETREEAGVRLQFWVIDGKVKGFRFPAFSGKKII